MSPMYPLIPGRLFWANEFFTRPGLYLWAFGNNRRVLPVPKGLLAQYRRWRWS